MTVEELKKLTDLEVLVFIRNRLEFENGVVNSVRNPDDNFHKRFIMSGYDNGEPGSCVVWNQSILNQFADLGIYDYVSYIFLDFYKGTPTLYLRLWNTKQNYEEDFGGLTTSEIILEIFKKTIFSDLGKRRRN